MFIGLQSSELKTRQSSPGEELVGGDIEVDGEPSSYESGAFTKSDHVSNKDGDNSCEIHEDEYISTDKTLTPDEHLVCLARFHRLLADHLFTNGQHKAALALAKAGPAASLCLTDIYEEAVAIEEALVRGDTSPAHAWCQEANFKLKKIEVGSR
ncbi:unnamed protein product [Protopolystoma xenopodis]|uniref:CTLH domain-containing protein n=1 Tax=Protopolystoma xenopodis TaxID=117903 RepID=A0A448X808_9PLAT|nr:unnamed protein product [Protopolystoma xenopodis]